MQLVCRRQALFLNYYQHKTLLASGKNPPLDQSSNLMLICSNNLDSQTKISQIFQSSVTLEFPVISFNFTFNPSTENIE